MTVMCFGTFDGLHRGHEDYFRQARELGDHLIVVVARDATVQTVKGRYPRASETERLKVVRAHPLVTEAHLGSVGDKYHLIELLRPEMVLLGYDQRAFTQGLEETLRARGLSVVIRRAEAYHPEQFKSSRLNPVCST